MSHLLGTFRGVCGFACAQFSSPQRPFTGPSLINKALTDKALTSKACTGIAKQPERLQLDSRLAALCIAQHAAGVSSNHRAQPFAVRCA